MSITSVVNDLVTSVSVINALKPLPPTISGYSVAGKDDLALDPAGGQTVQINGTGFLPGATITFDGNAIAVVTYVNPNRLTFTSPAKTAGTYTIYAVNSDGGTAIYVPGIIYSTLPTWTTAAGSLGSYYETTSISNTVVAAGDAPVTYSLFSGSLPTGSTLYANGVITGTAPVDSSSTTYSFTIQASDAQLQDSTRSFSLTINVDAVTWVSPANATTYTSAVDSAIANVTLSATDAAGYSVSYSANALPTGLSLSGANISGTPTVIADSSTLLTATAATTNRTAVRTINWSITVANDPYFEYNTLLIPGASTTFVDDASTNNFAVTINGDTKPNNNNPYTPGYYSNFFPNSPTGTSGFFVPDNDGFTFGSGSFTVEAYINMTASRTGGTSAGVIYGQAANIANNANRSHALQIFNTSLTFYFVTDGVSDQTINWSYTFNLNTWYHVAVARSGNTIYGFVNGVLISGQSFNVTISNSSAALAVGLFGRYPIDDGYTGLTFPGYISNLRIVKGTALYTSTFTPSTTPLTAVSDTALLTCQSNRFIDNSSNNATCTVNGTTSVSSFDPFTPNSSYSTYGSGYFDGTGDSLSLASSTAFGFGTGDFTIELWAYCSFNSAIQEFIDARPSDVATPWVLGITGTGVARTYDGATLRTGGQLTQNAWNHVAWARASNVKTIYVNGVSGHTWTASQDFGSTKPLTIANNVGPTNEPLTGYISNLRIVKGTAVYTTAFTPPTSLLTAISGTSLLTLQNNQSVNNNVFLDNSTNNFLVTRNGNTTQGTFSPYGPAWSNYFDGGTNRLTTATSSIFNLSGSSITLECWVFMTATPSVLNRLITIGPNSAQSSLYLGIDTNRMVNFSVPFASGGNVTSGANLISLNTWTHLAFVLSGSTGTLYIDGTQVGQTTGWNITSTNSNYFYLGYDATGTVDGKYTGYVSNVRLLVGTALYTSAFTPSTTPLTPITNTRMLTCQSNRIVDNSINNTTLTTVGSISIQRFSPFNPSSETPSSSSGYFDGPGDYLYTPSIAAFALGTGDFTIECWIYVTAAFGTTGSGRGAIISNRTAASSNTSFVLQHYNGKIYFGTVTTDVWPAGSNTTLSINTWYHVAVTRSSGTVRLFLNGVSDATAVTGDTTNFSDTSATYIGCDGSYGGPLYQYTGYISNVRIVNGTAVYTSNFTPLTSPLTAIANTSLLTCQSPTFIDNSTNNFTITAFGNSQPTQQNPFGYTSALTEGYTVSTIGGSGYFDGTGDYLDAGAQPAFAFGTGSWTVEAWVYVTTLQEILVFDTRSSASTAGVGCRIDANGTLYYSGSANNALTSSAIKANTWNHIAWVYNGTTLTGYINGVSGGTATPSFNITQNNGIVGRVGFAASGYMLGYMSDVRIVKGTAVYTSNFVPPSAPLTAVQNSSLLLNYTSAGIYDASTMNNMETVGDAKLSTAVSKFGGTSVAFDGTGDYLSVNPNIINNLGTSDFTIEAWVYLTSGSTYQFLIGSSDNASGYMMIGLNVPLSPTSTIAIGRSGINWPVQFGAGTTITSNTWTHIAITRSGTTNRAFINGTQLGSNVTDSTSWTFPSNTMWIGTQSGGTAFNGYMDDFRITKDYARYTANFTPPTSAFPIY